MQTPELPANEHLRQTAVDNTGLLDTGTEERFDRLTRMACKIFDVPIALVTLIDRNRQWFKSCQGLAAPQTPRDVSFCGHAILHPELFIIEDTMNDERFSDNPLVAHAPFIRFYAGAPLHSSDGYRLGTLCLIDRKPRLFDEDDQNLLRELADCVEREANLQAAAEFYQELRLSERRARAVIDGTRVGTWEWNVQSGDLLLNERWAEICGYRLEELEPVNIQIWRNLTHPDDLPESQRQLDAHFNDETCEYDYRSRMKHKDGHWVWVHDRGRIFERTNDGEPLIACGTHADITEEMQNLERIKQQNTALSVLNELALNPETNDDKRIHKALQLGVEYLDMPQAIVSEVTGDAYTVLWFDAPADSGLRTGLSMPLAETYCAITLEQHKSLAIPHMALSQYRNFPCYENFGLESYLASPIWVQNRLFGTLNFSSPLPRIDGFSDTETTFVSLLARLIAGVIERQLSIQTLTKLVEQTPGMLYQYRQWPDGTSTFPFASPGIQDMFGVSPEVAAHSAPQVINRVHPDDITGVRTSIAESAEQLTDWQYQCRIKNNANNWRWVEGRATPERLADNSTLWYGYISDIDDKKHAQIALQDSEERLRRLFELSPIGIGLSDLRFEHFLDVNDALLKPTGYIREEFIALDFSHMIPGGFRELRSRIVTELSDKDRFGPFEQDIICRDGSSYHSVIQGLRIVGASGRPLVWTLIEDISERKKIDRMKSEFISTVSHELRTPLTSIIGSLGLIASGSLGELPDEVDQMVAIATRNSAQLKLLIDDLLDMEKLASGKMPITPKPELLSTAVQETIDQLCPYCSDRSVTIRFNDHTQGHSAMIDRQRFEQALNNLLSNAAKFSPAGSEIIVTSDVKGNQLKIQVTDRGPGIPDNFRSRIFQKFAQADSSDTRGLGGTGLGLAITRELMVQMGGQVGFESEEGKGSTFWLEVMPA